VEIKPKFFQESEINLIKFSFAEEYVKNVDNIDFFKVLDFGEMFKYICQNFTVSSNPFPQEFMDKLKEYISTLKI
jgi:hypothetical protein